MNSKVKELDGKRKLNVRPWNVKIDDYIVFYDHDDSEILTQVILDPIKGRGYFSGKTRYKIRVKRIRNLKGKSSWNPVESTWYFDSRVEVYRK